MSTITSLAIDERTARIVLATACEPGNVLTGRLLASVGAMETLHLLARDGPLPDIDPVHGAVWRHRGTAPLTASMATQVLEDTANLGLRVIVPGDREWPKGLDDLGERAPIALWGVGEVELLATKLSGMVTVTGMRAATAYGETVASELSADLCARGRVVVAGGGYGIDQAVHAAALAVNGKTIAVLASGLDRRHPPGNEPLFERISESGLLLSELPPGAMPTRTRFLQRHRILAGVSGATVLVEAAPRSGALNSVKEALALGRPAGVVPGPVTSAGSLGTNALLRHAAASVVVGVPDIEALLEPSAAVDVRGDGHSRRVECRTQHRGPAPSL